MFMKYHIRRTIWALLLTGGLAFADSPHQYFGLTINVDNKNDVVKTLKSRHANFNDKYGYKGYSGDLPVIKVTRDRLMNVHGEIDQAWLEFTPDKKLYRIFITWRDSGQTYTVIKDVFDEKYLYQDQVGRGFVTKHIYKKDDTKITLTRNAFGFGKDQKTSVEYLHLPSVGKVESMKQKIDKHIKSENFQNKGVNL